MRAPDVHDVDDHVPPGPSTEPSPRSSLRPAAVDLPPLTPRRAGLLVAAWAGVLVIAVLAVVYPVGSLTLQRQQRSLLREFRSEVTKAANAEEGLAGLLDRSDPEAPAPGSAVGILDARAIDVRQVALEGVGADTTWRGVGHLPGSAGLGQPGNAALIGRRTGWGGPFGSIGRLRSGDRLVVTTVQGQSVYRVRTVRTTTRIDAALRPSADDRLTLVTSASPWPLATERATVVVARLIGRPFQPTPQNGRVAGQDGRSGDTSFVPQLLLFLLLFSAVAAATVPAHRLWRPLTTYLLTTPALVVLAVLVAESASRLLPAWA